MERISFPAIYQRGKREQPRQMERSQTVIVNPDVGSNFSRLQR